MQTALHIRALVAEIRRDLVGGLISSTEWYKKERAAFIFAKGEAGTFALGFVYHPAGSGFYVVPASKVKIETREKPWPFFELAGSRIVEVKQADLDRIFYLSVEKHNEQRHVALEAIGPNGNMWLLNDQFQKQATLRKREFDAGERYETAPIAGKLNPFEITHDVLREHLLKPDGHRSLVTFAEKHLIGFNHTLAKELAHRVAADGTHVDFEDDRVIAKITSSIADIAQRFESVGAGYLYSLGGATEAHAFQLSHLREQPEKFKTLSLAVMAMSTHKQTKVEDADERRVVMDAVARGVAKLSRRIGKLENDLNEAADFEKFKRYGELLQINFEKLKRGLKHARVVDAFSDTHAEVTIALDSALNPRDNVEIYFKRYRKGREGLELLQRRLEVSRDELAELTAMQSKLEAHFEHAKEQYAQELAALLPRESKSTAPQPRLPYREFHLPTGVTIYVGRDGSDNDRTTFEFAKPFELWFHTSQCPGSHVVMKFPNKSFTPSKAEIEETAAIAAFHSRAKNDSLVPVSYTERRYVRKPRQAKPGLVVIEREKSVMVAPKKPLTAGA